MPDSQFGHTVQQVIADSVIVRHQWQLSSIPQLLSGPERSANETGCVFSVVDSGPGDNRSIEANKPSRTAVSPDDLDDQAEPGRMPGSARVHLALPRPLRREVTVRKSRHSAPMCGGRSGDERQPRAGPEQADPRQDDAAQGKEVGTFPSGMSGARMARGAIRPTRLAFMPGAPGRSAVSEARRWWWWDRRRPAAAPTDFAVTLRRATVPTVRSRMRSSIRVASGAPLTLSATRR